MSILAPHVLFVHLGDTTGSSRALRQIRALAGAGYRVTVVDAPLGAAARRAPDALPAGVRLVTVPVPARRGPALFVAAHRAFSRTLSEVVADGRADVVHASDLHILPAAASAARRLGARLVYDAREWYAGLDSAHGRPWVGRAWGAVEARWAPRADAVLTVNDAIADRLAGARRIAGPVVLPNVSDAPLRAPTGELRREVGVPEAPLVLYQGLFRDGRGLIQLVDAMADVPEAHLVLIGEGPLGAHLRAQVERVLPEHGHVLPFTAPDRLERLTPDATVGAIVAEPLTESLRMGLPNKLFEYAAAGVPVLAGSGIEPLREAVETAGAGLAVDPTDRGALVAALRTMTTDADARASFESGLARLRDRFDAARVAERFLDVYRRLAPLPA